MAAYFTPAQHLLHCFAHWLSNVSSKTAMGFAGLLALADVTLAARKTALNGTATFSDALVLCPGLHRQQDAPYLSRGEFPACAAMTTGYVFRVENEATVLYLQRIGQTGSLTTLSVHGTSLRSAFALSSTYLVTLSSLFQSVAVAFTLLTLVLLLANRDLWAIAYVTILILVRIINIAIIRRRATSRWQGASEPGVRGDLLVLLSQDRWIRLQGLVDDLKALTSGRWLREPTFAEDSMTGLATLLIYLDVLVASNAQQTGKMLIIMLLCCSAGLSSLVIEFTEEFQMHGRRIKLNGPRTNYERRLHLANQLIKESGRRDWALQLGMVHSADKEEGIRHRGPVTM